ncbi:MAG: glycosyltransferase [Elusimicrobiota bacterium]|jgi:cellulose synthase/poly-beta-1,6-N-acetylglucosamine synthase-like glycosyltransferase
MTGAWPALQSFTDVLLVYYFFILNGGYLLISLVAFRDVYRHLLRRIYGGYEQLSRSPLTPPISVIVPAYNEEVDIALTVNNLLHLDYMRYEVIVVNDGSTDRTLYELDKAFRLFPADAEGAGALPTRPVRNLYKSATNHNLTVIDKENGGKSDALNAGLNHAMYPYFCSIDADVILEPDALQSVIQPIIESDHRVIGVGGIIRVANGCRVEKGRITGIELSSNPLVIFQIIEYYRAFLCGRTGFSHFNALMIISGAFGVFEKDLTIEIGGYRTGTVGEDMDLVTRLHAHMRSSGHQDYSINFVPDPVCWTEVPTTLPVLARQRRRWHKGCLDVLGHHDNMLFNPKYGALGMLGYPFLLVFEGWGILIEFLGYIVFGLSWWFGVIETDFAIAFFVVAFLCGAVLSLTGIMIGEMTPRRYPKYRHWLILAIYAFLENLGYRQLTSILRLLGTWDYLFHQGSWGRMERTGLHNR